ncbi:hypothetical protein [Streptomyces sp. XY431]|uniref:hypothetical protein n=1 Tax=Streptomyces sp. XY431 TaxID=1415562 RepID=UPI000A8D090A|nr:hypothetical protein [Streptomyces sp. XY431]
MLEAMSSAFQSARRSGTDEATHDRRRAAATTGRSATVIKNCSWSTTELDRVMSGCSPDIVFFEANADWLTVFQRPTYDAPDRNPQEGIWSLVTRGIGNLAAANVDHLAKTVRARLKKIQYRSHLIDGCLI